MDLLEFNLLAIYLLFWVHPFRFSVFSFPDRKDQLKRRGTTFLGNLIVQLCRGQIESEARSESTKLSGRPRPH